jgi:ABC-type multidrug transport system fused ATPase/permease subunit
MQEPNIFNFNIIENIVYGKLDAKNSEILKASETANCIEFIENKEQQKAEGGKDLEETAQQLRDQMEKHKEELIPIIGQ